MRTFLSDVDQTTVDDLLTWFRDNDYNVVPPNELRPGDTQIWVYAYRYGVAGTYRGEGATLLDALRAAYHNAPVEDDD